MGMRRGLIHEYNNNYRKNKLRQKCSNPSPQLHYKYLVQHYEAEGVNFHSHLYEPEVHYIENRHHSNAYVYRVSSSKNIISNLVCAQLESQEVNFLVLIRSCVVIE